MSESKTETEWMQFWKSIEGGLNNYIDSQKIPEVDRFLRESLAFFCYYLEDIHDKITLHKDLASNAYPLLVQLNDLLHSNTHIQKSLLLTSAATSVRTAFEIRINLKYIYQHQTPGILLQRLKDFVAYEEIIGRKLANNLPTPTSLELSAFAQQFPFWCRKDGTLKDAAEWNGEDLTAKKICAELKMSAEHFTMYKLTSKFVHGSPIVKNMYITQKGFSFISSIENVSRFTVMSTHHAMYAFGEFMEFFGVPFDTAGFNELMYIAVALQEKGEL